MLYANARESRHYVRHVPGHPQGKPEAFSEKENAAMRASMRKLYKYLREQKKLTNQTQFGALLGVGQQSAGKMLGTGKYGLSRPTALAYAQMCGFDSPESLLEDLGQKASSADGAAGDWIERDSAVRHARGVDYDQAVIDLVVGRYSEDRYKTRPRRWWMDRISQLQSEIDAERALEKAQSVDPELPLEAPKTEAPKRKRA